MVAKGSMVTFLPIRAFGLTFAKGDIIQLCQLGYCSWYLAVFHFYDLGHHLGFHYRLVVYISNTFHVTDPPTDRRQKIEAENNSIAGNDFLFEFNPIDLHKVSE